MAAFLAGLELLCLVLVLSPCRSQNTQTQSEQWIHAHRALAALPLPAARVGQGPGVGDSLVTSQHISKSNENLGIFIAAAIGIVTLMAVVYCIYNKFYTKHRYLHTPLYDDPDVTLDLPKPASVMFHGSVGAKDREVWRVSNASLSDTPSIITIPPSLSPPPSILPYPPLFLSSYHLRTISARDLERSFV